MLVVRFIMYDFEKVADFKYKCKHCGEIIDSGIINISEHWVKCSGKEFYSALMDKATKGLTIKDIEDLRERHLK